jgi:hypothetical protein
MIFHYQKLKKLLLELIDSVKSLLPQSDIDNATEMIEHNEFGIGFNIICEQLFEHDIEISEEDYQKIVEIGQKIELPDSKWIFLKS